MATFAEVQVDAGAELQCPCGGFRLTARAQ